MLLQPSCPPKPQVQGLLGSLKLEPVYKSTPLGDSKTWVQVPFGMPLIHSARALPSLLTPQGRGISTGSMSPFGRFHIPTMEISIAHSPKREQVGIQGSD